MKYKALRYLLVFVALFGLFAWIFTSIFLYFVGALIIASVLRPMANYFSQARLYGLRIPRYAAVIMSFAVFAGVISIFIILFIPVFSTQIEILSGIDYESIVTRISKPIVKIEDFMISNNLSVQSEGFLREAIRGNVIDFFKERNYVFINNLFSYTGQFLVGIVAVIFITFFMIYEDGLLRGKLISLIPNLFDLFNSG